MIPPTNSSMPGAPFAGLPLGAPPPTAGAEQATPYPEDHFSKEMHAEATTALDLGNVAQSDPALQSALNKMKRGVELLLSLHMDALSDAALRALWHKNNETDDAASRSRDKIHLHFDRLESQNKERLHQIHERMRARKAQSAWQKLAGIFKTIGSVVGAITGVASGGTLGLVAAACMAASTVMSVAGANEWATLAVGMGGAVLGAFAGQATKGLETLAQQLGKYASVAMRLAESVSNYEANRKDADAMDANADLQELRNERQQLLQEAEKEREAIESLRQAAHRSALTVIETLSLSHHTKLAALGA